MQQRRWVAVHTEALLWLQSHLPNISPDVTGGVSFLHRMLCSLQRGLGTAACSPPASQSALCYRRNTPSAGNRLPKE